MGEADGLVAARPGLALLVTVADCLPVFLFEPASGVVGALHAGWRGIAGGVLEAGIEAARAAGASPGAIRVAIGPGIGPCCFEIGPEVEARFPNHLATTRWGSTSVDLASSIRRELDGLDVWLVGLCTMHDPGLFSHRRNGTLLRHATIAWVA
jgi:YfiH family protein